MSSARGRMPGAFFGRYVLTQSSVPESAAELERATHTLIRTVPSQLLLPGFQTVESPRPGDASIR